MINLAPTRPCRATRDGLAAGPFADGKSQARCPDPWLPAGSTTEADGSTPGSTPGSGAKAMAEVAQRYPACAPVLTVLSDQLVDSTRLYYVTGDNTLANRTTGGAAAEFRGSGHRPSPQAVSAAFGRADAAAPVAAAGRTRVSNPP